MTLSLFAMHEFFRYDGSQHLMPLFIRTDGNAEAGMGLAAAAVLLRASPSRHTATLRPSLVPVQAAAAAAVGWGAASAQLFDYQFRWSTSQTFVGSTPANPMHGIMWWNQQDAGQGRGLSKWAPEDYGDNSGNVLIGATTSMALLNTTSWKTQLLYVII